MNPSINNVNTVHMQIKQKYLEINNNTKLNVSQSTKTTKQISTYNYIYK